MIARPDPVVCSTPYTLPYQVEVQTPPLLSVGGTVLLRVLPTIVLPDPDTEKDYDSVVTSFTLLASTGALSDFSQSKVDLSTFNWAGPRLVNNMLEWELSGCMLQEQSAVVLAQMFLLSHSVHPLKAVYLAAPGQVTVPLPHDPALENPYPSISQNVPFSLHIDPTLYASANLYIEFERAPSADEQVEIESQIITWATATAMGAYGIAPIMPNECSMQFEPTATFLDDELEFELTKFRSHRAALFGLANVCIALHQSVLQILTLRIE